MIFAGLNNYDMLIVRLEVRMKPKFTNVQSFVTTNAKTQNFQHKSEQNKENCNTLKN